MCVHGPYRNHHLKMLLIGTFHSQSCFDVQVAILIGFRSCVTRRSHLREKGEKARFSLAHSTHFSNVLAEQASDIHE